MEKEEQDEEMITAFNKLKLYHEIMSRDPYFRWDRDLRHDFKHRTSYQHQAIDSLAQAKPSRAPHARDVVDVESISRERHERMSSQNCL